MKPYESGPEAPQKRTTNVSSHATAVATPTYEGNSEGRALTAMSKIAEPHITSAVEADTKDRQDAAVAAYHANPQQAQEDAAVDSIYSSIFGDSVETKAINAEIAKTQGTTFSTTMAKAANAPANAPLTAEEFSEQYNTKLDDMVEAGNYDEAQAAQIREVATKYFPRIAMQQARSNMGYQQGVGRQSANDQFKGAAGMTDFSKTYEVANLKSVLMETSKTMGAEPFAQVTAGVVQEQLAAGDTGMYEMIKNDEQLMAKMPPEVWQQVEMSHDKLTLSNTSDAYDVRQGLMLAIKEGDIGKTEQFAIQYNNLVDNDSSKIDVNEQKLRAQEQAMRLDQIEKEKALKGPTDTASMDALMLKRATSAMTRKQNELLAKKQHTGLSADERTTLQQVNVQLEAGLSPGQVSQWVLDNKASALTVMNMNPNLQSTYVSDIVNNLSMTAPTPGESPETKAAREGDVFRAMAMYDAMPPQLRKGYVRSDTVRDFVETFKLQYGVVDQSKLTAKFATTNIMLSDTTDYTDALDEDVYKAADAYIEKLDDSLPWLQSLDDNSKARIRTEYANNYRKHGPNYAEMLSNRAFKDDTVMMGDASFTGMAGANKKLRDSGLNMSVTDYLEHMENTDQSFSKALNDRGLDLDDGNFQMTYTPSLNAVSLTGKDGVPVSLNLPNQWEDVLGRDKKEREMLKEFNIKTEFAPMVTRSLQMTQQLKSGEGLPAEVRKEYNIRDESSLIEYTMLKATVIADAAGLDEESAATYLQEVHTAVTALNNDKEIKTGRKQLAASGNAAAQVDSVIYDNPKISKEITRGMVGRYRLLVSGGQVSDAYITK